MLSIAGRLEQWCFFVLKNILSVDNYYFVE